MNRLFLLAILCLGVSLNWQPSEAKGLRVSRARRFFNRQMAERSTADTLPAGIFFLETIRPCWESAQPGEDFENRYLEVPVHTSHALRIWYNDFNTGAWSYAFMPHKMLIAENKASGELLVRMLFYAPDEYYAAEHPERSAQLARSFHATDFFLKDYRGLLIHTDLSGYPLDIREFYNGRCRRRALSGETFIQPGQANSPAGQLLGSRTFQLGTSTVPADQRTDVWDYTVFDEWNTECWFFIDSTAIVYPAVDSNSDGAPDTLSDRTDPVGGRRYPLHHSVLNPAYPPVSSR